MSEDFIYRSNIIQYTKKQWGVGRIPQTRKLEPDFQSRPNPPKINKIKDTFVNHKFCYLSESFLTVSVQRVRTEITIYTFKILFCTEVVSFIK